jgi:hypothetical protein
LKILAQTLLRKITIHLSFAQSMTAVDGRQEIPLDPYLGFMSLTHASSAAPPGLPPR